MQIKDAYEGEWWLPCDEARKVGGRLELGDKFELRLFGSLEEQDPPPLVPTVDPTLILGRSLGNAVTLLSSSFGPSNMSLFDGSSITSLHVSVALVGQYWLEVPDEAVFDKVDAELTNLVPWADQRAISREWNDDGTSILTNTWLPDSQASIPGALLKLGHGFDEKTGSYSMSWAQSAGLVIDLSSPVDIGDVDYKFVRPFRHLLSLATGVDSAAGRFRVGNKAYVEDPRNVWLDAHVYGRSKAYLNAEQERAERMLFTLADVDFAEFVPRWYQLVDKLGITCDLLFSANSSHVPFASNKLFNLASAVDGVHQRLYPSADKKTREHRVRVSEVVDAAPKQHQKWLQNALLFSHRTDFEQRLHALIDHAGLALHPFLGDRDKWVTLVKKLRNQFAHAPRSRHPLESDVRKLSRLSATIDVLLRIVLLREMGFSNDQCAEMTDRAPRWRYLKNVLPTELPDIF
ncbi:HEPN domain-containing protein [Actinophytocola sp.]|uniref:ApeA N-terminal domain 1-containing protein n=1 Tax=Actinophytocola sp. TaxID=1872138 RepID=UPI003899E935